LHYARLSLLQTANFSPLPLPAFASPCYNVRIVEKFIRLWQTEGIMVKAEKKFYLVREDILPESILKTALAKEMLASGEAEGIMEAVERLGMARSTFYKYKDGVFSFFNAENMSILNISLLLRHISGILSGVLNCVAALQANVLTINQNLPLHGVAYATLSLNIDEMSVSVEEMLNQLQALEGVLNVEVVGKS
jgi:chorismate mutase